MLSDHRPVTALFMVEVEEFCPRKLQKALTFTDAEIEDEEIGGGISSLRLGEVSTLPCIFITSYHAYLFIYLHTIHIYTYIRRSL